MQHLRTIPIGIVGIESNTVKAYLAIMAQYGLCPRTIIIMRKPFGSKGRLLARIIGINNANKLIFYLMLRKVKAFKQFQAAFQRSFQINFNFFSSVNFTQSCENFYEVRTNSINDPKVIRCIKDSQEEVFIYGGGGIVKDPIFELGIKLIHTHPGYLPLVRGSHGIFWSLLIRKKFGCSTFYMNKGIDLGEIILRKEYDISVFPKISEPPEMIEKLLSFYADPLVRAKTLIDIIRRHSDYKGLECQKQIIKDGETYYFMHELMRIKIASSLLV